MRRRLRSVMLVGAAMLAVGAAPAAAAREALNAYRVAPTIENKRELARAGFDLTEGDKGRYLEIYATATQARALAADGISARQTTKNAARISAEPYTGSDADYDVWTRYDAVPGDDKEQYVELYNRLEGLNWVKKVSIGKTSWAATSGP